VLLVRIQLGEPKTSFVFITKEVLSLYSELVIEIAGHGGDGASS